MNKAIIKHKLVWSLLISIHTFSVALCADPVKVAAPLLYDESKVYAVMELWYEYYNEPAPVYKYGEQIRFSTNPENTLAMYYESARNYAENGQITELDKLVSLYTNIDGAQDRIKYLLQEDPEVFKGFSDLTEAELVYKALWGPYHIFYVRLKGGEGIIEWPVVLYCNQGGCGLTDILDGDTDGERLLDIALTILSIAYKTSDLWAYNDSMTSVVLKSRKFKVVPKVLPLGTEDYSLNIYFDLNQPASANAYSIVDLENEPIKEEYKFLIDLIFEVKKSIPTGMEDVLLKNVLEYDESSLLRMSDWASQDALSLEITHYLLRAFGGRVLSWDGIKILAHAPVEAGTFVLFQPLLEDGSEGSPQIFAVGPLGPDGSYRLVPEEGLNPPGMAITQGNVLEFLLEEYGGQPTVFQGPTFGIDKWFEADFFYGSGGAGWSCSTDSRHYKPETSEDPYVANPEQSGSGYSANYFVKAGLDASSPWQCRMDPQQFRDAFGAQTSDEMYVEWYEYYEPDYPFPEYQSLLELTYEDETRQESIKSTSLGLVGNNSEVVLEHKCGEISSRNCSIDFTRGSGVPLALSQWNKLGLWVKLNTANNSNGFIKVFLDDEVIINVSDVDLRGIDDKGFNNLVLAGQYSNDGSPIATSGSRFIDTVKVFRSKHP